MAPRKASGSLGGEKWLAVANAPLRGQQAADRLDDMRNGKGTKVTKGTKGTHGAAQPPAGFIPPHGSYQKLLSYQRAPVVFDATLYFCDRFLDKRDRTHGQMVQAARSGKQNIIEGSMASG